MEVQQFEPQIGGRPRENRLCKHRLESVPVSAICRFAVPLRVLQNSTRTIASVCERQISEDNSTSGKPTSIVR